MRECAGEGYHSALAEGDYKYCTAHRGTFGSHSGSRDIAPMLSVSANPLHAASSQHDNPPPFPVLRWLG